MERTEASEVQPQMGGMGRNGDRVCTAGRRTVLLAALTLGGICSMLFFSGGCTKNLSTGWAQNSPLIIPEKSHASAINLGMRDD